MVRLGRGGDRARARRGQADPALGRLLGLPLVPRDGARVVRGPGHRGGHERALRQRQGRPRGAPRPRPDLPGRAPDVQPARRRLAAHRVPDAGRALPVLRRHLLPEGRALRHAGVSAAPRARRALLPRAQARHRAPERVDRGRFPAHAPGRRAGRRGILGRGRRRGDRRAEAELRFRARRLRRRAEVPASGGSRAARAALRGDRRQARAPCRGVHAGAHGRRRHLRPARRRLQPLLGRRDLDHPALREDALRQRAAAAALRGGLGRYRQAALRPRCRGDRRLDHARDAVARGRLLLIARRRLGARGGQVLRLDAARGAVAPHRRGVRGDRAALRPRQPGELRGQALAPRDRAAAQGHRRRARTQRGGMRGAPGHGAPEALRRARPARAPRPGRQGARELERARDPRHGAGGKRLRPRRLARFGPARARFSPRHDVAGRRARSPPPRTDARTSTPTSTTTRSCSMR